MAGACPVTMWPFLATAKATTSTSSNGWDWQDDRRARVQCYFAPEGFNTVEAYLAMDEGTRPDVEYFDQGKYDMLMFGYCVKAFQITLPAPATPVVYPHFHGLPDEVLNLLQAALFNRRGLPPGGTFSGTP
jgi:hypothetical protein